MTNINSLEDLLQVLKENPDWQDELRVRMDSGSLVGRGCSGHYS